jgi:hypothetical protein
MRKSIYILLLCIPFFGNAQMVKPSVFNMGGGFSLGFPVNAEWSIGESAAIGTYLNSALQLNAGVLQPKSDVVTSIPKPPSPFLTSPLSYINVLTLVKLI